MNTQEVLEPLPKRTKRCGHCHRDLSSESYRVHYQRFYDTAAHTWRQDVQDTPLFVPTLLREKAYEASSEVVPQSECLPGADMEDQSEINFDTCDSGSENEDKDDEVSTAQDDTPDVFIQSDVSTLHAQYIFMVRYYKVHGQTTTAVASVLSILLVIYLLWLLLTIV